MAGRICCSQAQVHGWAGGGTFGGLGPAAVLLPLQHQRPPSDMQCSICFSVGRELLPAGGCQPAGPWQRPRVLRGPAWLIGSQRSLPESQLRLFADARLLPRAAAAAASTGRCLSIDPSAFPCSVLAPSIPRRPLPPWLLPPVPGSAPGCAAAGLRRHAADLPAAALRRADGPSCG